MKLSVVMPAKGEEGSVGDAVLGAVDVLMREGIDYELIVVDDHSADSPRSSTVPSPPPTSASAARPCLY